MKHSIFNAFAGVLFAFPVAAQDCDPSNEQTGDPQGIYSTTTPATSRTEFTWWADADPFPPRSGNGPVYSKAWHMVKNLHPDRLNFDWPKVRLSAEYLDWLSQDSELCNPDFGYFQIDTDAPIITRRDGPKSAMAYVPSATSPTGGPYDADGEAQDELPSSGQSQSGPIVGGSELQLRNPEVSPEESPTALILLVYYPGQNTLQLSLRSGPNNGLGIHPPSFGIDNEKLASMLSGLDGIKDISFFSSSEVIKAAGMSEASAFQDVASGQYMRISTFGQVNIEIEGLDGFENSYMPLMLLSNDGEILAAKGISMSLFRDNFQ